MFGVTPIVFGDWDVNDGSKMHWPQTPDSTAGIAVSLSAVPLADDFNCIEGGPITDIHIWGSVFNDLLPATGATNMTFQLTIYSDIPASGTNYWSRPGTALWSKVFNPGEYSVRQLQEEVWQDWFDPDLQEYLANNYKLTFQYNFTITDINVAFRQRKGITYWLEVKDITATRDYEFGWKTTALKLRWNDDAVYSTGQWNPLIYPATHEYEGNSIDLAFVINSKWEPQADMECADLGDAPDSSNSWYAAMTAYPAPIGGFSGVVANFPTVYRLGSPPYGPIHWLPLKAYLGASVTREGEADVGPDEDGVNNIRPPIDMSNLDGADDGVEIKKLPYCLPTTFKFRVTIDSTDPPP